MEGEDLVAGKMSFNYPEQVGVVIKKQLPKCFVKEFGAS